MVNIGQRDALTNDLERYNAHVDELVSQIVNMVGAEMQRKPASMVYELINAHVERRRPGVAVDQAPLRELAGRIAVGLPPR